MKAVILAGGKGLRLREIVKDVPKPMAPVAGRPFMEYLVMQLKTWGIMDIILSVGYKGEAIQDYFGDGNRLGINIGYSAEEKPLGTGGAIKKAASAVNDGSFIVMNGDSFLDVDFDSFISFYKSRGAQAALALPSVGDTHRYGSVKLDGNGAILAFIEKGRSGPGFINGGIYLMSRRVAAAIPDGNISIEKDIFPGLINNGLFGMSVEGFFIDMGLPDDYRKLQKYPGRLHPSKFYSDRTVSI